MSTATKKPAPSRRAPAKKAGELVLAPLDNALGPTVAKRFNKGAVVSLDWEAEKRYAMALLQDPNNEFMLSCALANPRSLADAMLDLSRIGLSLSPVLKQAYLIPSSTNGVKKVGLTPSYIGMEQGVIRSGKVLVIQTELVYENDSFERWVDTTGAQFKFVPARKDRGELEGGFCFAKFSNGEVHVEYMEAAEILAIEEAATRKNNGKITPAWRYWKPEMQKKGIVRRAAKHWPTDKHVETMFEVMDRNDPMDFGEAEEVADGDGLCLSLKQIADLEASLDRVPETARGEWVHRTAQAMGFTGGAQCVPEVRFEEMITRLSDRMDTVYGPVDERAAQ